MTTASFVQRSRSKHSHRAFSIVAVTVAVAAMPLRAQESKGARQCVHWVETGEKPAGVSHNSMLDDAVRRGDGAELARAAATLAEDLSRTADVRGRAVELVIATMQQTAFRRYEPALQQLVARALSHATT